MLLQARRKQAALDLFGIGVDLANFETSESTTSSSILGRHYQRRSRFREPIVPTKLQMCDGKLHGIYSSLTYSDIQVSWRILMLVTYSSHSQDFQCCKEKTFFSDCVWFVTLLMIITGEIHTSNDISFANTQATSTITTVTLCVWLKNPVYIVSVDFTWDYCSIIMSKLGQEKVPGIF